MPTLAIVVIAVLVLLPAFLLVLFKSFYKVPRADEALIITGWGVSETSEGGRTYRIKTGSGSLVWPVFQKAQYLSLGAENAVLHVEGVDSQMIPISVRGNVVFKVGDDARSITNAATRFLDSQNTERGAVTSKMHELLTEVIHGHLRSIIGGLTVEDLISKRNELAAEAREASADEIQALGLVIDSLQIQDVSDKTGYIQSLGEPRAAEVRMLARIAQADRDREATEREQASRALMSAARRDTAIKEAGFQAETEKALATASQQGPLAEALARQEVVQRETEVAELEAERTEKTLDSSVRRPADARAYQTRVDAEAAREARIAQATAAAREAELTGKAQAEVTKVQGTAEADALRARGLAEAEAIAKRAEALERESDAVIAQQIADRLPEIVKEAAGAFDNVEHMIVLNGAAGVSEVMAQVLGQAGPILEQAKSIMGHNGKSKEEVVQ